MSNEKHKGCDKEILQLLMGKPWPAKLSFPLANSFLILLRPNSQKTIDVNF